MDRSHCRGSNLWYSVFPARGAQTCVQWVPRPLLKGERLVRHPAVPTVRLAVGHTGLHACRNPPDGPHANIFSHDWAHLMFAEWGLAVWTLGGVGAGGLLLTLVPAPLNSNGHPFPPSDNTDPE